MLLTRNPLAALTRPLRLGKVFRIRTDVARVRLLGFEEIHKCQQAEVAQVPG